jgi:hypothetical protein
VICAVGAHYETRSSQLDNEKRKESLGWLCCNNNLLMGMTKWIFAQFFIQPKAETSWTKLVTMVADKKSQWVEFVEESVEISKGSVLNNLESSHLDMICEFISANTVFEETSNSWKNCTDICSIQSVNLQLAAFYQIGYCSAKLISP